MNKMIELLSKIEKRPGLYLGCPTFIGLKSFIDGYTAVVTGKLYDNKNFLDIEFQDFVQGNDYSHKYSWYKIISVNGIDDRDAFYIFFKELNRFLSISQNYSKCEKWPERIEGGINVNEVLEIIRNDPYSLLIEKNLDCINHYIYGMCYIFNEKNFFSDFNEYVAKKFKYSSVRGWVGIIRFNSKNEEDAFQLFFELYDEFRKQNKV